MAPLAAPAAAAAAVPWASAEPAPAGTRSVIAAITPAGLLPVSMPASGDAVVRAGLERVGALVDRVPTNGSAVTTARTTPAARALTPREARAVAVAGRVTENVLTRIALALAGVAPGSATGPAAPAVPSSALLLVQWALFRRGENPLFNRTPSASPRQTGQDADGDVTGTLGATDPDGDRLSFTVSTAPRAGTVTVAPDGTYTYDPGSELARTGGTDSFVVTVRDHDPSARGLGGLTDRARAALAASHPALAERLFGSHTRDVRVEVTVAPVAPPVVGTVDPVTGVSRGNLGVVAGPGERLVLTVTEAPRYGTFVVDDAGNWTYTPTAAARLAAARTEGRDYDAFSVLVERVSTARTGQARMMLLAAAAAGETSSGTIEVPPAQQATPAVSAVHGANGMLGQSPRTVQASPNGRDVYVGYRDGSFAVVDATTGTTSSLPVNGNQLEFTADGSRAVTVGRGTDGEPALFVVDTATNVVVGTVAVGQYPSQVRFTPDGRRAVVVDYASGDLTVVDLVSGASLGAPRIGTNGYPTFSSDGTRLFVLDADGGDLTVIDTTTGAEIGRRGGFADGYLTLTADDGRAIVTKPGANTVTLVDTTTLDTVATHVVGSSPGVHLGPDASRIVVVPDAGGEMLVLDTATGDVVATVTVGAEPSGLWFSTDGSRVYLGDRADGRMRIVDLAGDAPVRTVDVGSYLKGMRFAGDRAYVVDGETGRITILDTAGDLAADPVVRVVELGVDPSSGVLSPDGYSIWFAGIDGTVTRIDTRDDTVTPFVGYGGEPVFSLDGAKAYLVRADGRTDVVDAASGRVTATLDVRLPGLTSPDGRFFYGTDRSRGEVTFVSTLDDSVVVLPVPLPTEVGFSADGSRAYVASSLLGAVTVVALDGPVVPVVAPVPSGPPVVGAPNTATGAVTGGLGFDDPTLVVRVTERPGRGNVNTGPDGTFRYEPTAQARRDAALTPGPDVDTFVITFYDGRGGRTDVPITVTVAPITDVPFVARTVATGTSMAGVFLAPDGDTWVVGTFDGTVRRIDAATGESTTFSTGGELRFSADGRWAYVTDRAAGVVTVVDAGDGRVVDTVTVGGSPIGLTFSPDGTRLYVRSADGGLSAIDTATNTLVGPTHELGTGSSSLTFASGGDLLLVTDTAAGRITAVDVATNAVAWTRDLEPGFDAVQVGRDPARAYVVLPGRLRVAILDTATGAVVDTVDVGVDPVGDLVFSADGSRAFATSTSGGTVAVIDTGRDVLLDVVTVGARPSPPQFAPDGSRAYVTSAEGTITVLDPVDARVVDTITVEDPGAMVFAPDGATAWVRTGEVVIVIDVATDRVVDTITVGAVPLDVVFSPDGTRAVLVARQDGRVTVVDAATRAVVGVVEVGSYATQPVFSPDGSRLYLGRGMVWPDTLVVVDTASLAPVSLVDLPPVFGPPTLTPDGRYVSLRSRSGGQLVLVSTADDGVTVLPAPGYGAPAVSADGRYLYTVDSQSGTTTVIMLPQGDAGVPAAGDLTLA